MNNCIVVDLDIVGDTVFCMSLTWITLMDRSKQISVFFLSF